MSILLAFMMFSGFDTEPAAECMHIQGDDFKYDQIHPHKEYALCRLCGVKLYTGITHTMPHGNGKNGTCKQCGSHSYTGRTCVDKGVCKCGATISAYGHTIGGVQYSDAEHPHPYFKYCTVCGDRVYIGGIAVKNHGDGTWGSGTCPECGTHSFVGQSCTADGVCACGDTISKLGHTLEGVTYSLATHPHPYFEYCTRCWTKVYTSGNATKNHGDGTPGSGTCPECGTHSYYCSPLLPEEHPHTNRWACGCGDYYTTYSLEASCSICTGGLRTASNTEYASGIFSFTAGDLADIPMTVALTCYVDYYNEYAYRLYATR